MDDIAARLVALSTCVSVMEDAVKGRKLVALEPLTQGQLLWTEQALIWADAGLSAAVSSFLQSPSPSRETAHSLLTSLHYPPDYPSLPLPLLRQLHPLRGTSRPEGAQGGEEMDVVATLHDVFRTNGISLGGTGGGVGIFLVTSMLNHSCTANVRWEVQGTVCRLYAGRGVPAGEELCANYLGSRLAHMDVAARQAKLQASWGFTCTCPACTQCDS